MQGGNTTSGGVKSLGGIKSLGGAGMSKPKPASRPRSSLQQAANDTAFLDNAINEGKAAVLERDSMFGSMGDEEMGAEGEKKKRAIEDTKAGTEEDGRKEFWVSKWRVDEAIHQIGGEFKVWILKDVAPMERQAQVNKYLEEQMAKLTYDEQLHVRTLPNNEQIPLLGSILTEKAKLEAAMRQMEDSMQVEEQLSDSYELEQNENLDLTNPGA